MPPEFSILLPVRDAAPYLSLALRSLSSQTLGDWVCLVLDDGSRDGPFLEDYDLFLRLLRQGEQFGKVPKVLLGWRDHPARHGITCYWSPWAPAACGANSSVASTQRAAS